MNTLKTLIYNLSGGFSFLPFQFTVNISNICNRRCKHCPNMAPELVRDYYQQWWKKQPKLMDYDKFEDFLKRMGIFRKFIRHLSFTGRGDPGLHPDLLKFCQLANRYRIHHTITTNGDFLTQLQEYELSKLRYFQYVRVSLFDYNRADYWRDRITQSRTTIKIHNETGRHIEGFEDGFLSCNNPGTDQYMTMPKSFVKEPRCTAPFHFNTLNTDGSLVTCITFFEIGNVFETPFWKLWNNKKMRTIRKQALKMAIPKHLAFCEDCGFFMRQEKYQKMNSYENS
jgi:MoaA/NifB/PqqE/SkfB family radical SAM enzyme